MHNPERGRDGPALGVCDGKTCASNAQSPASRAWAAFPNSATVSVEVPSIETARARGLMVRSTLAPDQGMLFLFEQPCRCSDDRK